MKQQLNSQDFKAQGKTIRKLIHAGAFNAMFDDDIDWVLSASGNRFLDDRVLNSFIRTADIGVKTFEFVIGLVVMPEMTTRECILEAVVTHNPYHLDPVGFQS